jgi:hypothetical protein
MPERVYPDAYRGALSGLRAPKINETVAYVSLEDERQLERIACVQLQEVEAN